MRKMTLYVAEAKSERPIHELEALLLAEPGVERALVVVEDGKISWSWMKPKSRKAISSN